MPRLPGISQKDAVRVFQKLGYRIVRESGHLILSNGECRLVIPNSSASCPKKAYAAWAALATAFADAGGPVQQVIC